MLIRENYFKNIFNTVREAILILDENMRVLSANRSFFKIFRVDSANTIGSLLYDLGNGQWNIPHLRVLLEDILPKNDSVDDYKIEHNFESIGQKTMLLNACKIRENKNDLPIIFLAIEDITVRGRAEAELQKSNDELDRRVQERTMELAQANAMLQADIVERKHAGETMRRQLENVTALREISIAIGSSLNVRITLNILLEKLIAQLGVDAADVLLLEPDSLYMNYSAGLGFRTSAIQKTRVRIGKGHVGNVAYERRTVIIPDLSETLTHALKEEEFKSYVAVPLVARGKVEGVLEIFQRRLFNPTPEWLNFLELVSGQAAIAIDNAALFDSLQRLNTELTLSYDATLEGWGRALELRDAITKGHTERVTEKTVQLARLMGVDDHDLVHVRRGALLHDIGKIHIPDRILLKPGPLTQEEAAIMQLHPVYAHELLSPIPFLRPSIDIPYCHHEKWDGSGYPRGLKGELIPFKARIFSVIDVADALISDRPYRPGWSLEKTYDYIEAQRGIFFAPEVVEAFLDMKW